MSLSATKIIREGSTELKQPVTNMDSKDYEQPGEASGVGI